MIDKDDRLIIPNCIADCVLESLHLKLGHPGERKLRYTLKKYLRIEKMIKRIRTINSYCIKCKRSKGGRGVSKEQYGILFDPKPFNKICLDIKGPIPTTEFLCEQQENKFYLLAIIDIHTRMCKIVKLTNLATEGIIEGVKNWISMYHAPKFILSDRGRQFMSQEYLDFLNKNKIKPLHTTVETPQGNGICERVNSTISDLIRICKGMAISTLIKTIETRMNITHHTSIKSSPIEYVTSRSPLDPIDRELHIEKLKEPIRTDDYGQHSYTIGQWVMKKINNQKSKTGQKFSGPYLVIDVRPFNVKINTDKNGTWINVRNVKPFGEEDDVIH